MSTPCRSAPATPACRTANSRRAPSEAGLSAEPVNSVANALMLLRDTWDARETPPRILICGSLYLAGAVLAENGTPPLNDRRYSVCPTMRSSAARA